MLNNLKHMVALTAGKKLLNSSDSYELSTGKRVICIIAGAFILRKGLVNITKKPIISIQEIALGGLLLYNGATGINKLSSKPASRIANVRLNQIQGNNPNARVPEFI
ncbi:MAG: hypothetical protein JWQ28_593 [Pedobacter sp.]|jgi:hypothetical protein|nr:hypothetical protein [Pedobacter sp.]